MNSLSLFGYVFSITGFNLCCLTAFQKKIASLNPQGLHIAHAKYQREIGLHSSQNTKQTVLLKKYILEALNETYTV